MQDQIKNQFVIQILCYRFQFNIHNNFIFIIYLQNLIQSFARNNLSE